MKEKTQECSSSYIFWCILVAFLTAPLIDRFIINPIFGRGQDNIEHPKSIDQQIKERSEHLYIEYKAEIRALDRIEAEIK